MKWITLVAASLLAAFTLAACSSGPSRTVASFCTRYYQLRHQYLAQYGHPSGNGLEDLANAFGAIGQWPIIFEGLDQVAPASIEPAVLAIADSLKQEASEAGDEASNPLGALASGLATSLESQGSWRAVSNYISVNCQPSIYDHT